MLRDVCCASLDFQSRLEAQTGLLALRADEADEYRRRYHQLNKEKDQNEEVVLIGAPPHQALPSTTGSAPNEPAVEVAWRYIQMNHLRERLDIARRYILMYTSLAPWKRHRAAPEPHVFTAMLDRTSQSLVAMTLEDDELDAVMRLVAGDRTVTPPERLMSYNIDEAFGEINAVLQELVKWIDVTIEELT